ncbi:MAG: imidazole glycerol phosphate synthase subunit HisF [Ignavibacteriaceae bacterium]|nr:imidazole glycerol phosphate synthase subunit HisF [Ignavibacteriaceae bacterium]HMN25599.1 AglZ/HisF2 family acetamidino modification protein [Ignavibacteriaceae bacterium]
MFLPRIIPVLLLKGKGLVKTVKFKEPRYLGDPINAVKIFNDLKADELIFLDITASKEGRTISVNLVKDIGDEAFMPFGVGGGISDVTQIEQLFKVGAEKVVINTNSFINPDLIKHASNIFGSQSIVVSLDVKKNLFGKYECWIKDGSVNSKAKPLDFARKMEDLGAGELIINSIDCDGLMTGYDLGIIRNIADSVAIPVVACGGAGDLNHLKSAYFDGKAHALAAGSMFVYHGPRKAVLINYPSKSELINLFNN